MKHASFVGVALAIASSATAQIAPVAPAPSAVPVPPPTASPTPPVATITSPASPVRVRKRPPSAAELRVRTANRDAMREPVARGFVNAVQVYPYNDGVLYRLFAAPERVSDITLQPGEAIVSIAAGDTVRWTVGDTTSGGGETKRAHILIKPFSAGLSTNLIITTDRRTYHVQLESTAATAMAALSWTYPVDDLIAIRKSQTEIQAAAPLAAGLALERLNFGYAITGDTPPWRPLRAFDDGKQTFIEFPAGIAVGEAPPLFVLGADGNAELVNYRMSGRFYVVDRLFDAAELRLGGKKQAMVRVMRGNPRRRERRAS